MGVTKKLQQNKKGREMAEAYFIINVAEKFHRYGCQEVIRDLQVMLEVKSVEVISGASALWWKWKHRQGWL